MTRDAGYRLLSVSTGACLRFEPVGYAVEKTGTKRKARSDLCNRQAWKSSSEFAETAARMLLAAGKYVGGRQGVVDPNRCRVLGQRALEPASRWS